MEEKKGSKLKENIDTFRSLMKNPKYYSLMKLFLFFIFFLFLFLFVRCNSYGIENNIEESFSYKDYSIYEYKTNIYVNDYIYTVEGKRYKNKYNFIYGDKNYAIDYDDLENSNVIDLDLNIINAFNFSPDFIDNIVENSELISEKKLISEGLLVNEYSLDLEKYSKIIDYNLNNYELGEGISIILTEKNEQIISVELDLTNFYKNIDKINYLYKIIIEYDNINNVLEF